MIKEKILQYINKKNYSALDKKSLFSKFEKIKHDEFEIALKELLEEYKLIINKKGKIISARKGGYFALKVTGVTKDSVYVEMPDLKRDIKLKIYTDEMYNIRYLDTILIKEVAREYRFEKILKHNLINIVGEYIINNSTNRGFFKPENKNFQAKFEVNQEDSYHLVDGHKVVFNLIDSKKGPKAKLNKIIGHKNDPGVDIETKVIESSVPYEFGEALMKEIEYLPEKINKAKFKNRLNLTNKIIFTIDGADAKDIDDAVECYKLENGNYKLGVHIADISYYVNEGTLLDIEASNRGTSIYLADRVIPMYPHKISNGICSLNQGEDRLAISCYMEINNEGKIISSSIHESIINSKKRFTYKEVNQIIEFHNPYVIEKNQEFTPMLKLLQEVAHLLRKNRDKKGQLELQIIESKIILDEEGKPIDIQARETGEGERLIEDCMIAANESVAEMVSVLKLPFLYRTHEAPDIDKIIDFSQIVKAMEIDYRYSLNTPLHLYLSNVLKYSNDEVKKEVLSSLFLRSLPKAIYNHNNIGHFGLASKCYTHFTAPIRRYPDTLVHRLLKKYIINHDYLNKDFNESDIIEELKGHGETTSMQERRAIQLERDVEDMKKAEYMIERVGEQYLGKVSGFIEKGLFLRLDNTVEGFINYSDLIDDFYKFDKERYLIEGVMSKKTITIGDTMKIVVVGAEKTTGKIDFKPVDIKYNNKNKKGKGNKKRK